MRWHLSRNRHISGMSAININLVEELAPSHANYWLDAIVLKYKQYRDCFFKELKVASVMLQPVLQLINEFTMYHHCQSTYLSNAKWLEKRVVNISSSARDQ